MLNQDTSRGLFFHRCLLSITYLKLLEILKQLNHKTTLPIVTLVLYKLLFVDTALKGRSAQQSLKQLGFNTSRLCSNECWRFHCCTQRLFTKQPCNEMPMAVKTDFDSTVFNQAFDTTYVNNRRLPNTDWLGRGLAAGDETRTANNAEGNLPWPWSEISPPPTSLVAPPSTEK